MASRHRRVGQSGLRGAEEETHGHEQRVPVEDLAVARGPGEAGQMRGGHDPRGGLAVGREAVAHPVGHEHDQHQRQRLQSEREGSDPLVHGQQQQRENHAHGPAGAALVRPSCDLL